MYVYIYIYSNKNNNNSNNNNNNNNSNINNNNNNKEEEGKPSAARAVFTMLLGQQGPAAFAIPVGPCPVSVYKPYYGVGATIPILPQRSTVSYFWGSRVSGCGTVAMWALVVGRLLPPWKALP